MQSVRTMSPNSQEKQERVFTTFEIMLCKEEATEKLTITKKSVRQFISIDAIDESPAQEFTIDTRSAIPTEERQKSIYENHVSQLNSPIRVTYKPQEKTAEIKETAVFKTDYFIGFQPILHPVPILSTIQFEDVAAVVKHFLGHQRFVGDAGIVFALQFGQQRGEGTFPTEVRRADPIPGQ